MSEKLRLVGEGFAKAALSSSQLASQSKETGSSPGSRVDTDEQQIPPDFHARLCKCISSDHILLLALGLPLGMQNNKAGYKLGWHSTLCELSAVVYSLPETDSLRKSWTKILLVTENSPPRLYISSLCTGQPLISLVFYAH